MNNRRMTFALAFSLILIAKINGVYGENGENNYDPPSYVFQNNTSASFEDSPHAKMDSYGGGDPYNNFANGMSACSSSSLSAQDRYNCNQTVNRVYLTQEGVDCIDCNMNTYMPEESKTNGWDFASNLVGPLAFLGSTWITANAYEDTQARWAKTVLGISDNETGAYKYGHEQCTSRYNSALDYNMERGSNPFTADQLGNLMDKCNGYGYNMFSGMSGLMGSSYGGVSNPYLAGGYSPGFMSGMIGPYAGGGAYIGGGMPYMGAGAGAGIYLSGGAGGYMGGGMPYMGYPSMGAGAGIGIGIGAGIGMGTGGYMGGGMPYMGFPGISANIGTGGYIGGGMPYMGGGAYMGGGMPYMGYPSVGGSIGAGIGIGFGAGIGTGIGMGTGGYMGGYNPYGGMGYNPYGGGGAYWGGPSMQYGLNGLTGYNPYMSGQGSYWDQTGGWNNQSSQYNQQYQQYMQYQQYLQEQQNRQYSYQARVSGNEVVNQRNNQLLYQDYASAGQNLQRSLYSGQGAYYGGSAYGVGSIGGSVGWTGGASWDSTNGGSTYSQRW